MTDDDSSTRSVTSVTSVGHTGGVITSRSGGMSDVLLSEISLITQRRSHAPVLALLHAPQSLNGESTGWNISRESMHHLTVSNGGSARRRVLVLRSSSPHPAGSLSAGEPICYD